MYGMLGRGASFKRLLAFDRIGPSEYPSRLLARCLRNRRGVSSILPLLRLFPSSSPTSMPRVVIHAAFQTAPAHTAKVKELLHAAMKTSVAEPGCEYYVGVYPLSITSSFTRTLVCFFYLPYANGLILLSSFGNKGSVRIGPPSYSPSLIASCIFTYTLFLHLIQLLKNRRIPTSSASSRSTSLRLRSKSTTAPPSRTCSSHTCPPRVSSSRRRSLTSTSFWRTLRKGSLLPKYNAMSSRVQQ
jgi:hypothetical protein